MMVAEGWRQCTRQGWEERLAGVGHASGHCLPQKWKSWWVQESCTRAMICLREEGMFPAARPLGLWHSLPVSSWEPECLTWWCISRLGVPSSRPMKVQHPEVVLIWEETL